MVKSKHEKRKCKFCSIKYTTRKTSKNQFCSAICEHDNKRMTIYKKFGRGPSYEYVCRALTVGNRTGDAYGLTLPRELVEEHDLLGKKFKVEVSKKGILTIKTQIKYTETK